MEGRRRLARTHDDVVNGACFLWLVVNHRVLCTLSTFFSLGGLRVGACANSFASCLSFIYYLQRFLCTLVRSGMSSSGANDTLDCSGVFYHYLSFFSSYNSLSAFKKWPGYRGQAISFDIFLFIGHRLKPVLVYFQTRTVGIYRTLHEGI